MNWKTSGFLLAIILVSCQDTSLVLPTMAAYPNAPIIEVATIDSLLDHPQLKIIDFRKEAAYTQGHIPGALQLWRNDIEDPTSQSAGMMASSEQLEQLLQRLGIQPEDQLVVYDDKGGSDAARLWWILQHYHFDQVYLLDGGLRSWVALGGSLSKESPSTTPSELILNAPSWELLATKEEVENRLPQAVLIDTRSQDEFHGTRKKRGAAAAGRIPGSLHMDWASSIEFHGSHRFKSRSSLDSLFKTLIPSKKTPIITYCHSGVRSAHTTFVLTEILGYENVRNYDGSWTEWSELNRTQIQTDSLTKLLQ